jgi:Holliday junction resolvase RusA-like endonuclease
MKRKCEEIIIAEIQNNALRPIASPCTIVFKWIEGNIRRDLDNVAFAKKFVLDALQKAEILPNDDQKYVKGFRDNFEFGNVWGCEVTINEIGGLL